jgi:16S rRNA (guanine966-N2)-methyltransferase
MKNQPSRLRLRFNPVFRYPIFRYGARMRITSGILRNRRFEVPNEEVRPTMESVREAIFSSLGGTCEGMKVLDLFAGSGALGMEAWSRGADSVTFVEQHPRVWKNLEGNIQTLRCAGLGETKCIKADAVKWLNRAVGVFDLILADPPYDLPNALSDTLEGIALHSVLTPDGILVYELRSKGPVEIPNTWQVLRDKKYGKTRVLVLKLNTEDAS